MELVQKRKGKEGEVVALVASFLEREKRKNMEVYHPKEDGRKFFNAWKIEGRREGLRA